MEHRLQIYTNLDVHRLLTFDSSSPPLGVLTTDHAEVRSLLGPTLRVLDARFNKNKINNANIPRVIFSRIAMPCPACAIQESMSVPHN